MTRLPLLLSLVLLPACQGPAMPDPPRMPDLSLGLRPDRPETEAGICWASDKDLWFRAPCPEEMTADRIATLQRALEVRGFRSGEITGEMDRSTRDGIRKLQAPLGLDSDRLSLDAARYLGLVPIEIDLPDPQPEPEPEAAEEAQPAPDEPETQDAPEDTAAS
ncbi:peptidoglycan-binding domain-containing protein [Rhodobacter sp. NSM]|uniref:peptidoglycan-binding domain-containing protein n=1 Tax=Rhodobacter sp. NSM TaxID=3457501 RepID=UPI003FD25BB4